MSEPDPTYPINELRRWERAEGRREERARWTTHIRALQRCTCPATPGTVRTIHEPWCPWGILNALEQT